MVCTIDILTLTLFSLGSLFLVIICYFVFPFENRVRLLSLLLRKPYGMLELAGKGKEIRKFIVNFAKDTAEVEGKVFVLIPEKVYRKEGIKCIHFNELDAINPITFSAQKLQSKDMETLPEKIEVDKKKLVNFVPISFEKEEPKQKYANPELIKAIFMKQKALAEAKTLFEERTFKILLIGILIVSALAIAFSYQAHDKIINEVIPLIKSVQSSLQAMKTTGNVTIPVIR